MKQLKVALIGNPNVGKTSVFNALTGLNQHVGNYPGVTVERKIGTATLAKDTKAHIIDVLLNAVLVPHVKWDNRSGRENTDKGIKG